MSSDLSPNALFHEEAEKMISALHASGSFQVLRKLDFDTDSRLSGIPVESACIGLCLDTETTGLEHDCKIIELGIVAFEYVPDTGEVLRVIGKYNGFEDPGNPLPQIITQVTGITDEMLCGRAFEDQQVLALAEQANLVIAHNAGFDRPFVERRYPVFAKLPWACTCFEIDWQAERLDAKSLEFLLFKFGRCINAHRALDDAEGVLGLLLETLPVSRITAMKALLDRVSNTACYFYVVDSPFDKKDILKQRGYRWHGGSLAAPKCWWIAVPESSEKDELDFLTQAVYSAGDTRNLVIKRVGAIDRFSVRAEV